MLPNSPAADPFYQKLHKLKITDVWIMNEDFDIDVGDVEEIYADIAGPGKMIHKMISGRYVVANRDMQYYDFLLVAAATREINHMPQRLLINRSESQMKKILDIVFSNAKRQVDSQMEFQQPLIDRYGFIVHGQYLNKRWYNWTDF
jgi:hypothetical protein